MDHVVSMKKMPFDVIPTTVHKPEGVWGEPPAEQLLHADALIREHLERKVAHLRHQPHARRRPQASRAARSDYGSRCSNCAVTWPTTTEHGKRHRRNGSKFTAPSRGSR